VDKKEESPLYIVIYILFVFSTFSYTT